MKIIALMLVAAALLCAYFAWRDQRLNHQLHERQRELGYTTKKRSVGRFPKLLTGGLALSGVLLFAISTQEVPMSIDEPTPKMTRQIADQPEVMSLDTGENAITLQEPVSLVEQNVELEGVKLLGSYEDANGSYEVFIVEGRLVYRNSQGQTFINEFE